MNTIKLIDSLEHDRTLGHSEFIRLLSDDFPSDGALYLQHRARCVTDRIFGRKVRIRGLIEITNVCRNDCLYCGLRKSNRGLSRYTLSTEEILECCRRGHDMGFRTFVLQGGENPAFSSEKVVETVTAIHHEFDDSAITLSLGEWDDRDLLRFREAGASRYLLRHETIDPVHYSKLHPDEMSRENRLRCLRSLKRIGYQTGTGIMVGSPFQTLDNIADDLLFMRDLNPEMIGIGPFIPHSSTPFANMRPGNLDLTLKLISILRLMFPCANIPATTALHTLHPQGRDKGLLAGANVVMPNLSPSALRKRYSLYDNKKAFGAESAEGLATLASQLEKVNLFITTEKGDYKNV